MAERRRPLVDIGLPQTFLGLGLDGVPHLLRLGLEREPQVAVVEEQLVHAVEDTDGDAGSRDRVDELGTQGRFSASTSMTSWFALAKFRPTYCPRQEPADATGDVWGEL
jgi:hypothetical protein